MGSDNLRKGHYTLYLSIPLPIGTHEMSGDLQIRKQNTIEKGVFHILRIPLNDQLVALYSFLAYFV